MRISDWSSDVCSSDLRRIFDKAEQQGRAKTLPEEIIDPAIHAAAPERISCGRSDIDRNPARRDGTRPQDEQPVLPAVEATLIFAKDLRAFFHQHDPAIVRIDIARKNTAHIARLA